MIDSRRWAKWVLCGLLCIVVLGCQEAKKPASGDKLKETSTNSAAAVSTTEPANTGVNARDRDNMAKTPMDQNENSADVKITADIRKRVVDSKMSVDAHNIKIITQDGKVTLRGPVESADEKQTIEKIASDVAGASKVDNQLDVEQK